MDRRLEQKSQMKATVSGLQPKPLLCRQKRCLLWSEHWSSSPVDLFCWGSLLRIENGWEGSNTSRKQLFSVWKDASKHNKWSTIEQQDETCWKPSKKLLSTYFLRKGNKQTTTNKKNIFFWNNEGQMGNKRTKKKRHFPFNFSFRGAKGHRCHGGADLVFGLQRVVHWGRLGRGRVIFFCLFVRFGAGQLEQLSEMTSNNQFVFAAMRDESRHLFCHPFEIHSFLHVKQPLVLSALDPFCQSCRWFAAEEMMARCRAFVRERRVVAWGDGAETKHSGGLRIYGARMMLRVWERSGRSSEKTSVELRFS